MSHIFRTLTAGFSRFVLAWLVPSFTSLMIFVIFILPEVEDSLFLHPATTAAKQGKVEAAVILLSGGILLSLLSAFTAAPMTRVLEGYYLPVQLRRRLLARQLRLVRQLQRTYRHYERSARYSHELNLVGERLDAFPARREDILPTRLGNAYRAAEVYGIEHYKLDGQSMWYELQSSVSERLQREWEDTQAQVDFFIGFIGQFGVLAAIAATVGIGTGSGGLLILSVALVVLSRLAYIAAVKNMVDLQLAIQAIVNMGRLPLANSLGYKLPTTLEEERKFWAAWTRFVNSRSLDGGDALADFDTQRRAIADDDST